MERVKHMNIGALRSRITIQENRVSVDDIGNHLSVWNDYFSCWATVSGTSGGGQMGGQGEKAGQITDHSDLSFTVRFSSETAAVGIKTHRIVFDGNAYDIVSIDLMNMKKKCLKFKCRRMEQREA